MNMAEMYEPILIVRESVAKCENGRLVAVAHGCGVSVEQAQSAVLKVWAWARRHAKNGFAEGVQPEFVDKLTGVQGFAKALESNRWLTLRTTGLEFPEWDKYLSSGSSANALASARQSRRRARQFDHPGASPPTVTLPRDTNEQTSPTPPVVSGGLFGHLPEGKAVQSAWDEFCKHREEKSKKGWTKSAQQKNARKVQRIIEKRGAAVAVVALERAVECGWTGVFEPAQVTEHDLKTAQQVNGSAETKSRLREMGQAERDELLAEFRRTVPAKEQAKDGAFGRWAADRLTPSPRS